MFSVIGADGREYGPVPAAQLREWIAQNRVTPDMLCRAAGSSEWRAVRDVPELQGAADGGAPTATATAAPPGATPLPEAIEFTGEWKEYFKIWIVNVLLTAVTLGIYAAWAKVRRKRYFYSNTKLFGHAFEYLADPLKIFYGNVIVVAAFLAFTLSGAISPLLQLPFILLFAVAVPWIIARAFAFNARNTAWRGLRFMFSGRYGGAFRAYVLWPLLVPITAGLLYPFVLRKQKEWNISHHHYGTTPFVFNAPTGEFYRLFLKALLFMLPLILGYVGVFASLAAGAGAGVPPEPPPAWASLLVLAGFFTAFFGITYVRAGLFNLTWNYTEIAGHGFVAEMRARDLLGIQVTNGLVTLLTLGLMAPWAKVRLVRFQLSSIQVVPGTPIEDFVAAAQPPVEALGDVAGDFFDFDLGFGV